ncbi:unnamed protein product [Phaedon cochleariae]|uniref:Spondin-1 n=1 Tax=Phaedon cochleariae TaxID=80249 RepID=A0A9N9SFF6_PHACE|nr:unnamed protein product [Phaedon cochleariae]
MFILTVEPIDSQTGDNTYHSVGQFEFEYGSQILTKFSEKCPNTVVENSKLPKMDIQVYWVAPPENSGCIAIKASVVETRDNWFSEDGQLTKILCEDDSNENVKPEMVEKCCACDEAKYESDNIRTIIKARGLQYPNITESSYAVFRVDNKNHLVSLVSKITPSPDWIVGVSDFELCMSDCTWAEYYSFNLYPIDVGTDDGIEYSSSRPIRRQKEITSITPNNPNDPRSPFYNEDGEPINPIAKLHFTRQRVYEKPCEILENEDEDHTDNNLELSVATVSPNDEKCELGRWSEWSSCSVPCGTGIKTRDRKFKYPGNKDICRGVELQENMECEGEDED